MIDTDKYEGHTEGKWDVTMDDTMEGYYFFRQGYDREQEEDCDYDECRANARLMSDAPLFLEAYKRLRLVADELYLHIVGEPHMTLDELVAEMPWRNEE